MKYRCYISYNEEIEVVAPVDGPKEVMNISSYIPIQSHDREKPQPYDQ